jgi:hypothetical protein
MQAASGLIRVSGMKKKGAFLCFRVLVVKYLWQIAKYVPARQITKLPF